MTRKDDSGKGVDPADGDAPKPDGDAPEPDGDASDPEDAATTIAGNATDDGDGREWKFAVDDVGPDGVTEDTATPDDEPIEPGDVTLEHAVFVALGVAITVGTFVFGF